MSVTEETIRELALEGATDRDICDLHELSESQLHERFWPILVRARAERRVKLRRLENAAAEKGNSAILTLLGKNELGQSQKASAAEPFDSEPEFEPKVG